MVMEQCSVSSSCAGASQEPGGAGWSAELSCLPPARCCADKCLPGSTVGGGPGAEHFLWAGLGRCVGTSYGQSV